METKENSSVSVCCERHYYRLSNENCSAIQSMHICEQLVDWVEIWNYVVHRSGIPSTSTWMRVRTSAAVALARTSLVHQHNVPPEIYRCDGIMWTHILLFIWSSKQQLRAFCVCERRTCSSIVPRWARQITTVNSHREREREPKISVKIYWNIK